jgi:hypothetical protein
MKIPASKCPLIVQGLATRMRNRALVGATTVLCMGLLVSACSSTPNACADIERVLSKVWQSEEAINSSVARGEELTEFDVLTFYDAIEMTTNDLRKISEREMGEVSKMADLLAKGYAVSNSNSEAGEDYFVAGYLMLNRICGISRA